MGRLGLLPPGVSRRIRDTRIQDSGAGAPAVCRLLGGVSLFAEALHLEEGIGVGVAAHEVAVDFCGGLAVALGEDFVAEIGAGLAVHHSFVAEAGVGIGGEHFGPFVGVVAGAVAAGDAVAQGAHDGVAGHGVGYLPVAE